MAFDLPNSLSEACHCFSDPDKALSFVAGLRWPYGAACPDCGVMGATLLATRRIWKCNACKRQFSVKVGTIFEDSAVPLGKWLIALWIHANSKNGVSSCELARTIGVTQKTAWHMAHRIRLAMESGTFQRLSGTVEADETFVGGRKDPRRHKTAHRGGTMHKATVFGAVERKGRVRAFTITSTTASTLQSSVKGTVIEGSTLYTDNHSGYIALRESYGHKSVSHSTGEYARGPVHTNTIENFWCLFKRSVKGTWVCPSRKHLDRFVIDQEFRYNHRGTDDFGRMERLTAQIFGRRLTWKDLVG